MTFVDVALIVVGVVIAILSYRIDRARGLADAQHTVAAFYYKHPEIGVQVEAAMKADLE